MNGQFCNAPNNAWLRYVTISMRMSIHSVVMMYIYNLLTNLLYIKSPKQFSNVVYFNSYENKPNFLPANSYIPP